MSIFGTILDKLGFKKPPAQAASKPQTTPAKPAPQAGPASTRSQAQTRPAPPAASTKPHPQTQTRPAPQTTPAKPTRRAPDVPDSRPAPSMGAVRHNEPAGSTVPATPAKPAPMEMVDVVSKLEGLAANNPQKLNWKTSIVDLLKLLDIDSSLQARRDLAVELSCPPEKMADSASMNIWLHKTVLQKLAENGGNVPKELLD